MKGSHVFAIAFTVLMSIMIGFGIHQDHKREDAVKEQVKKGLGKQTSVRDLGMIDDCHVKHYVVEEDKLVKEEVQHSYDTFYVADCNGTETTTQKVGGKFKSDQAIIKKPKE